MKPRLKQRRKEIKARGEGKEKERKNLIKGQRKEGKKEVRNNQKGEEVFNSLYWL